MKNHERREKNEKKKKLSRSHFFFNFQMPLKCVLLLECKMYDCYIYLSHIYLFHNTGITFGKFQLYLPRTNLFFFLIFEIDIVPQCGIHILHSSIFQINIFIVFHIVHPLIKCAFGNVIIVKRIAGRV